jgi:DNA-binding CsgD family transcriptional regulator
MHAQKIHICAKADYRCELVAIAQEEMTKGVHIACFHYPRLTNTDIQVIALYILGMDNSDICLLLGLTQRTVWSRRQRIKARIGMGEKESLDAWIERIVG